MIAFQLNDGLLLLMEPDNKKLRLVIINGTIEMACRKETPGKLNLFLSSAGDNLFKGRMQLHKNGDVIGVIFKKNQIGTVTTAGLKKALNAFK